MISLGDYVSMGIVFFDSPEELMSSFKNPIKNPLLEHGEFYPLFYNSNIKTLKLLDLIIKEINPSVVVETGVANGISTRQILSSFKELNLTDSRLYSFDIYAILETDELKSNPQFNFILIDSPEGLTREMSIIGEIDLFYHDSNHAYENQMHEYETAWKMLKPNGALVSDDIQWSDAFIDFCKKVERTPLLLCDHGTYAGVIRK